MAICVEDLYRKYGPMVLRRCRAILHDEDAALDAMQDTFVQVLRREKTLQDRGLSSLLYTIAGNVCLNELRRRRRRPSVSSELVAESATGCDDLEDRVAASHFLDRLLANENESTRSILTLRSLEQRTWSETATCVNLSVTGARRRVERIRERALVLRDA